MHETAWPQPHRFIQKYNLIFSSPCLTAKGFCAQYRKLFLYFFGFPFREDDFVDKEEDQHQNVTVEHRGSDVIDKVRHQQARNRRSHAVDEVNEAGDQTECQHQAICLARSTLPRNTKLRWIRYRIFIQSRENGRVRAQNGSCNLACLDHASNVHQQL